MRTSLKLYLNYTQTRPDMYIPFKQLNIVETVDTINVERMLRCRHHIFERNSMLFLFLDSLQQILNRD